LWRTGDDSVEGDRWHSLSARFEADGNPDDNGPGGWNDPDIMLIGLDRMTMEENRTNMTLWSVLAAPLLLGNDVRHMSEEVRQILVNKEVIAIDQDTLGNQGHMVVRNGGTEVWTKSLADGSIAVALFNRENHDAEISFRWADLGLEGAQQVRDLWRHINLGKRANGYSAIVPTHVSVLLRVRKS
jgi:alpha-galactosidase